MTLHLSHIFFTDARTFICLTLYLFWIEMKQTTLKLNCQSASVALARAQAGGDYTPFIDAMGDVLRAMADNPNFHCIRARIHLAVRARDHECVYNLLLDALERAESYASGDQVTASS